MAYIEELLKAASEFFKKIIFARGREVFIEMILKSGREVSIGPPTGCRQECI
jgi:hypothetical protein